MIVAGNAYLGDKLEPELAKRSMPCGTRGHYRSAVGRGRPLADPENYCVEDCNYLLDYYRLTGDNRLLYGGGVVYGARSGRRGAADYAETAENLPAAAGED